MRKVKIYKVSDDRFNGEHPNGINAGFTAEGVEYNKPTVGESYWGGGLRTSTVTEVIDDNNFKTLNSTYRLEEVIT